LTYVYKKYKCKANYGVFVYNADGGTNMKKKKATPDTKNKTGAYLRVSTIEQDTEKKQS
jgi:hypothetical protein